LRDADLPEPDVHETMGSPHYNDTDVDSAIIAAILCGSSREASRQLKTQGLTVPSRTIRGWVAKHPDRVERLQRELAPRVAERVAARSEQVALASLDAQAEAIEQARKRISELDADKASATARNLAVVGGISMDKLSGPLRGRPSVIIERREPEDLLRQLEAVIPKSLDANFKALEPGDD
jgi:hypothetical protein